MPVTPRFDKKLKLRLTPIVFRQYEAPQGFLINHQAEHGMACHGLMYYSLVGKNAWEEVTRSLIIEGQLDPTADLRTLFKNIAFLYGVEPEHMQNFWPNVRLQWGLLGLNQPPDVVVAAASKIERVTNDTGLGDVISHDLTTFKKLEI